MEMEASLLVETGAVRYSEQGMQQTEDAAMTEHKHPDDGGPEWPNKGCSLFSKTEADEIERQGRIKLEKELRLAHINLDDYAEEVAALRAELEQLREDRRFEAARMFAAAWLPAVIASSREWPDIIIRANELGLAMADDLLRRLRENQA